MSAPKTTSTGRMQRLRADDEKRQNEVKRRNEQRKLERADEINIDRLALFSFIISHNENPWFCTSVRISQVICY